MAAREGGVEDIALHQSMVLGVSWNDGYRACETFSMACKLTSRLSLNAPQSTV